MPIYIAVEVARRELEARLLLGLVAAERGHDVVLGKLPHRALLGGELDGWRLPPGILHLKSMASSERIYGRFDALRERGWSITVQDEEHGLAGPEDYEAFGRTRFPADAVLRADRIFAWGPHDASWLEESFPERRSDVAATGSPRIDLWRPEVIISARRASRPSNPFILVVSSITPFARNPFWVSMLNARLGAFGPGFDGDDDPREFEPYDEIGLAFAHVKHVVRAVRRLSLAFPSTRVVFRPHHFEEPDAWWALLGDYPNLEIDSASTSRELVADAAVVIHCGSSIALEATTAGRQVLKFCPVPGPWTEWAANRVGSSTDSIEQLVAAVDGVLAGEPHHARTAVDESFLSSRLASLNGPLASDRIVDEWERILTPELSERVERIRRRAELIDLIRRPLRVLRGATNAGKASSGKGSFAMEVEHKFPSLDVDALRADAARLSEHLGRFKDVEIIRIGEREVLLRAAGR